jgi:ABC-2 type transport system ATP-binding protein
VREDRVVVVPARRRDVLPILQAEGLVVEFGSVRAVGGFDLSVAGGASVALVGRNGAGKSTTMRVLAGVLPATSGSVRVAGVDAGRDPAAVRAVVGYCPDVGGLIPRATAWEHLQLSARLRGMRRWRDRAHALLESFDLQDDADRVTAGFSHGMSRRLSVVLAAFHEPRLLLLDEPFDGVDPLGVDATLQVVGEARRAARRCSSPRTCSRWRSRPARRRGAQGRPRRGAAPPRYLTGPDGDRKHRALIRDDRTRTPAPALLALAVAEAPRPLERS